MSNFLEHLRVYFVHRRLRRRVRRLREAVSASDAIAATNALLTSVGHFGSARFAASAMQLLLEVLEALADVFRRCPNRDLLEASGVVAEAIAQTARRACGAAGNGKQAWLKVAQVGIDVANELPGVAAYLLKQAYRVVEQELPSEAVNVLAALLAQQQCRDDEAIEVYARSVELSKGGANPCVVGLLEDQLRITLENASEVSQKVVSFNRRLSTVAVFALRNLAWHAIGTGEQHAAYEMLRDLVKRGAASAEEMAALVAVAYQRGDMETVTEAARQLLEFSPGLAKAATAAVQAEQALFSTQVPKKHEFIELGNSGLAALKGSLGESDRSRADTWQVLHSLLPSGWELLRRLAAAACLCLYAGGERGRGCDCARELLEDGRKELTSPRLVEMAVLGTLAEQGPSSALALLDRYTKAGHSLAPSAAMLVFLSAGACALAERLACTFGLPGTDVLGQEEAFALAELRIAQGYWSDAYESLRSLGASADEESEHGTEARSQLLLSASDRVTPGDLRRLAACAGLVRAAVQACESEELKNAVESVEQARRIAAELPAYLCDWRDVLCDWADLRFATLLSAESPQETDKILNAVEKRWGAGGRLQLVREVTMLTARGKPDNVQAEPAQQAPRFIAETWVAAARAWAGGDDLLAEEHCAAIVREYGSRPNAWVGHALVLTGDIAFARGDFRDALKAYEEAVRHKPSLQAIVAPRLEAARVLGTDSATAEEITERLGGELISVSQRVGCGLAAWRRGEWKRLVEQWLPLLQEPLIGTGGEEAKEVISTALAEAYSRLGELQPALKLVLLDKKSRSRKLAYLARVQGLVGRVLGNATITGACGGMSEQPEGLELLLAAWVERIVAKDWDAVKKLSATACERWPEAPEVWLWSAVQAGVNEDWEAFRSCLARVRDSFCSFSDGDFGGWLGRARGKRPCYGNLQHWTECGVSGCEFEQLCGLRATSLERVHAVAELLHDYQLFLDGDRPSAKALAKKVDFSQVPLSMEHCSPRVAALIATGGTLEQLWSLAASLACAQPETEKFESLLIAGSIGSPGAAITIAIGLLARSLLAIGEGRYGTARAAAKACLDLSRALKDGGEASHAGPGRASL